VAGGSFPGATASGWSFVDSWGKIIAGKVVDEQPD